MTVEEDWLEYAVNAYNACMKPEVLAEFRRAYFAGAAKMFADAYYLYEGGDASDLERARKYEALKAEFMAFIKQR